MIGNALRFALGIFRGIIIFVFAIPKSLRAFRNCFFTEGVVEKSGIFAAGSLRRGWIS